jgi:outer membrane protein assembly factor BamD
VKIASGFSFDNKVHSFASDLKNMRGIRFFYLILIAISIFGCSRFRKIQKSGDWKVKYDAAIEYYEDQDYHRATMLFEDILPIIRGTAEAELGNFYLAYCYYNQKQYILSAHHFDEFVTIYGRSEYVTEAMYMHAYSLYLQSPDYQLDQTVTYEAVAAMQNFINLFPISEYAPEADQIIDELQAKLEKKAFEKCRLWYKLRRYKSALTEYETFRNEFPDSDFNEEVAYLKIETSHDYAMESIRSKQQERFTNTVEYYLEFLDKYPNSKFLRDAEKLYASSIQELSKFANSKI